MRPEDAQLVDRYLAGQGDAYAVVEDWIGRAARPFRRRLGDRWEDVLQDVRLEVTRLLQERTFRGDSALKTYLWRVVCHTCLDRLRAQARWQWTEIDALPDWEAEALLSDPEPGLGQESKDLLLRVVERVPGECRKLWSMVLAGLSYREMSDRTGVAEGTLRVRVLRCRKRAIELRAELLGSTVAN
jgi:RNA polymerase sigma-70 factor (ECF subfamily)